MGVMVWMLISVGTPNVPSNVVAYFPTKEYCAKVNNEMTNTRIANNKPILLCIEAKVIL